MSFSENKQFWESFIELYKSMPCLWNIKSKQYTNRQLRNEAYAKLAEKCKEICPEAEVKFVRKKIDSLRAGFRRELREIRKSKRTGSSADSVYETSLWYFDLLLFTQDQEEVRPGTSTCASLDLCSDEDTELREEELETTSMSLSSCPSERSGKSRKFAGKENTLAQKKAKFLEAANAALSNISSSPYEPFGKSVAVDLENMEPQQRIIAQKIISEVLFYGKLEKLTEYSSFSVPPTPFLTQGVQAQFKAPYYAQQYQSSYCENQFATKPSTVIVANPLSTVSPGSATNNNHIYTNELGEFLTFEKL